MIRPIPRRAFFVRTAAVAAACAVPGPMLAGEPPSFRFRPEEHIIPAPDDPAQWADYRQRLAEWRSQTRAQLQFDGALYRRPDFAWCASAYACCFVMLCDEAFYDARRGRYTVEEFLDHGEREFGGYDSLVLWHAYPRIGVDLRNQFDFYRDMPGGLKGLLEVAGIAHRRGVRVFIDYNPWDSGTRREGQPDLDVLVQL